MEPSRKRQRTENHGDASSSSTIASKQVPATASQISGPELANYINVLSTDGDEIIKALLIEAACTDSATADMVRRAHAIFVASADDDQSVNANDAVVRDIIRRHSLDGAIAALPIPMQLWKDPEMVEGVKEDVATVMDEFARLEGVSGPAKEESMMRLLGMGDRGVDLPTPVPDLDREEIEMIKKLLGNKGREYVGFKIKRGRPRRECV